jgi:hypothetical protein
VDCASHDCSGSVCQPAEEKEPEPLCD